jgi:hypothetical protein
MFSARWAHRALVGFCVLLVLGVLIFSAHAGWLGPELQAICVRLFEPLTSKLQHAESMERVARVLGAVGTLLTAAVGVYKGIYYADRNLPERLMNLFRQTDERLSRDRAPLLQATTGSRMSASVQSALFYEAPLNAALHQLSFPKVDAADKDLKRALAQIEKKIEVALDHHRVLVSQKVTAHILRGSIASNRAEEKARQGKLADDDRQLAESEFSAALALHPDDLDGLELRGRQRELRGNFAGAHDDFEALIAAALASNKALRAARGQRYLGELKERRATAKAHWDQSRASFVGGIAILDRQSILLEADSLEKALLHLGCGRVQIKLGRIRAARTNLQTAINELGKVKQLSIQAPLNEAKALLKSLEPPLGSSNDIPMTDKRTWLRRLIGG